MTCELHGLRYPNLSPDLRNSQPLLLWIRFQPPWKISFPSATLIPDSQIGSFDGMLQTTSSPLTLFNPFSFVLFWLGSFKIPVFCLTDSFFCLIHFAVGIFYCIFNFIHCILQYRKFYLVLFNDFYLFVKLPVSFFMLLSWFHFFFSVLPSVSLSFMKTAISNSLSGESHVSMYLGSVTRRLL